MRSPEQLPHIFDHWQKLIDSIKMSHELLLGFDFDGTLAPIVSAPDLASLDSEITAEIVNLRQRENVTIAILSGRSLRNLADKVKIDEIILAGDHGFKVRSGDGTEIAPVEGLNFGELKSLSKSISRSLTAFKDVEIEEKEFSVSVHYRNAPAGTKDRLEEQIKKEITGKPYTINPGRMCWEINPLISWNKGKAFTWIQNHLFEADKRIFRLYIGDDRTDEDVFEILEDGDFSILVLSDEKKSATRANYRINSQVEVAALLKKLNQQWR